MKQETFKLDRDGIPTILKTEPGKLDYTFDWSDWLGDDTITTFNVTVSGGITLESYDHAGSQVVAWLSGGRHGRTYLVRCRITTAAGRIEERTVAVTVVDRRG